MGLLLMLLDLLFRCPLFHRAKVIDELYRRLPFWRASYCFVLDYFGYIVWLS